MNCILRITLCTVLIIILLSIVDYTSEFLRKIRFKLRPRQIQYSLLTLQRIEEELWNILRMDEKCDTDALFTAIKAVKHIIYQDSRNITIRILSGSITPYIYVVNDLLEISILEVSSGKHIYQQKYEPIGKGYLKIVKYCLRELETRNQISKSQSKSIIQNFKSGKKLY